MLYMYCVLSTIIITSKNYEYYLVLVLAQMVLFLVLALGVLNLKKTTAVLHLEF